MGITVLQLHKRASYEFKYIQDKYALNSEMGTFALADGTTQSFNSEFWAEIITKKFVENPKFNENELTNLFLKQVEVYKSTKFEFSSNPAKASLEKAKQNKGGTATFIGIQLKKHHKLDVIACGDSNLFILNSENKIIPFPFTDVDSLDSNNFFINTENLQQNKIDEKYFEKRTFECSTSDILILATDALSRLILKKPSIITEIIQIEKFEQLHEFCLKYWENKELQEDDISALIIPLSDNKELKFIYPPKDFSFPKEKEVEFIPVSLPQKKQSTYTDMEINEIRNQFNGVAHDFNQVKKKLKLHELLLMVSISLLLVNILLTFNLKPTSAQLDNVNEVSKLEVQSSKSNKNDSQQQKENKGK